MVMKDYFVATSPIRSVGPIRYGKYFDSLQTAEAFVAGKAGWEIRPCSKADYERALREVKHVIPKTRRPGWRGRAKREVQK